MSSTTNPTVQLNVTEKELRALMNAVPYNSPYGELRSKLINADLAMAVVRRIKNRERKAARQAKRLDSLLTDVRDRFGVEP